MTEYFDEENQVRTSKSCLSITKHGLGIFKSTVKEMDGKTDLPERLKFGIDEKAGYIVAEPCFDPNEGYSTEDMEVGDGFRIGSTALVEFYTERIPGLSKEEMPMRFPAFWDEHDDRLCAEF